MMASMEREVVHLNHTETIRNIAAILDRVERRVEVVIEKDRRPMAIINSH